MKNMKKKDCRKHTVKKNEDMEIYENLALRLLEAKAKFAKAQSEFEDLKQYLYDEMEICYNNTDIQKINISALSGLHTVTRIQNNTIEFDIAKLEKRLNKQVRDKVIKKHYLILDYDNFVKEMKKLNADAKTITRLIHVDKTVDTKALENLEELGKINKSDIEGCYKINKGRPYFKVGKINDERLDE